MILTIKDANFANAGAGTICEPVLMEKTSSDNNMVSFGNNRFSNGDKLHYRVKLNNVSAYAGTTIEFAFAIGNSQTGISGWMAGAPQVKFVNQQNGDVVYGDVVISGLNESTPYLQFSAYNMSSDYYTERWEIEVIKIN